MSKNKFKPPYWYHDNIIFSKDKIDGSLMPEGLIASITEEELVDLVEYLMTLKKG